MLVYVEQDIFESPAQVIVNTVNTVGVMGKGIAKRYKAVFPEMYQQYRMICEQKLLDVGKLWLFKTDNKWVLNFPTKKHWRNSSKIEYLELGLKKFVETYEAKGINSISFPQLGVGNGGLDWNSQVKPIMEKYLKDLPIDIFIHLYSPVSKNIEHLEVEETLKWLHQNPKQLSVHQVWDDLVSFIDSESFRTNNLITATIVNAELQDSMDIYEIYQEIPTYIEIEKNKKSVRLTLSMLLEVWVKLRETGYLFSYEFPSSFRNSSEIEIFSDLFTQLNYIDFIRIQRISGKNDYGLSINKINLPVGLDEYSKRGHEYVTNNF